jgi:tRNA threonylcarbamoyladenosine biosynthesis protein TsaE
MRLLLPDAHATETLGQAMAATRPTSAVVYLHGELGAGKSTLARALLRALGVTGAIRSPTYTLVEHYPLSQGLPGAKALHLDLYRIGDAGELEFLGLDVADATLWLVEWPERGGTGLPKADLRVDLDISGSGRNAALTPVTKSGHHWLERLAQNPELQALLASS